MNLNDQDRQDVVSLIKAAQAAPGRSLTVGLRKYSDDQPRDDSGRFGDGGGGGGGGGDGGIFAGGPGSAGERAFIADGLSNDDSSSDDELVEHWVSQGVEPAAAAFYITQRDAFLRNPMPMVSDLTPYTPAAAEKQKQAAIRQKAQNYVDRNSGKPHGPTEVKPINYFPGKPK